MNIDELDHIIDEAIASSDQTRPTGKVEAVNKILPHLRLIKSRSERLLCFWQIADRLKIDRALIREELEKATINNGGFMSRREDTLQALEDQRFPIYTVYMLIGPALAAEFLKKNTRNYRKLSPYIVDKMAKDMLEGRWGTTHQGIAFDREGRLSDGQNRLSAIVKSGCEVLMAVTYNLEPDAAQHIDGGKVRSVREILTAQKAEEIRNIHTAIARLLCGRHGVTNPAPSKARQVETFFKHELAIRFAVGIAHDRKRIAIAAVLAPIARAWYSVNRSKLEEFGKLLAYGYEAEVEMEAVRPVFLLREYLLSLKSVSGSDLTQEIYRKTERALTAYLKGESVGRLTPVKEEMFPLPNEIED